MKIGNKKAFDFEELRAKYQNGIKEMFEENHQQNLKIVQVVNSVENLDYLTLKQQQAFSPGIIVV